MGPKEEKVLNTKEPMRDRFHSYLKEFWKSLPLKIVLLTFSGGAICVLPFLVLQMRVLGLSISEIAVMYLITPVAALLGPVISGVAADKLGRFSLVFVSNVILSILCFNTMLIIPSVKTTHEPLQVLCNEGTLEVHFESCGGCYHDLLQEAEGATSGVISVSNCQPCSEEAIVEEDCSQRSALKYECPVLLPKETITLTFSKNGSTSVAKDSGCAAFKADLAHPQNMSYAERGFDCVRGRSCDFRCEISDQTHGQCAKGPKISLTFIWVFAATFAGSLFVSSAFTMLDATVIQYAKENNLSIGKQKIMTMIGFGVTPLLSGVLIDYHSAKIGRRSFFSAIMLANALMGVTCLMAYFVSMKVDKNNANIMKDFRKLVTRLEVDLFLFVTLILGCNYGFIESYLFIYLQSLGASNFLLGLTMTVGCFSSIPMLFCSDWVETKLGRHVIFVVCFTAYAARMIGYSFIVNPWMCLIFEALEAITYQLMWVTCLKLCPLLAPKGLLATMTGMAGAIHYSFGKGIGGFIGGQLIKALGLRNAFRAFGGLALAGGLFYIIIHYAYLKKKIQQREEEIKNEEEKKKAEEGAPMIANGPDTPPPSYEETTAIDLRRSYVAHADPQARLSIEAFTIVPLTIKRSSISSKNTSRRGSKEVAMKVLNGSTPHLYVTEAYDILGRLDIGVLSRSEENIEERT